MAASCPDCGGRWRQGKCRGRCYREAAKLAENQALANSNALTVISDGLTDAWEEENKLRAEAGLKNLPVEKLTAQHRKLERGLRRLWRNSRAR